MNDFPRPVAVDHGCLVNPHYRPTADLAINQIIAWQLTFNDREVSSQMTASKQAYPHSGRRVMARSRRWNQEPYCGHRTNRILHTSLSFLCSGIALWSTLVGVSECWRVTAFWQSSASTVRSYKGTLASVLESSVAELHGADLQSRL